MIKTLISIGPKQSLARASIFTLGHFFVDSIVITTITGAPIELAGLAALVGPLINGTWFWFLDRWWSTLHEEDDSQHIRKQT